MQTSTSGVQIDYDDQGQGEPALLLMAAWAENRASVFSQLAAQCSPHRRTLALDWRGHGLSETPEGDFGANDLVEDALAVIQASGAQQIVPVAIGHAGWIAIELQRRLTGRIPKIVLLEWMVFEAPPSFLARLQTGQSPQGAEQMREQITSPWLKGVDNPHIVRIIREMQGVSPELWARAAREISSAYIQQGAPLQVLAKLDKPVPVLHLYAQKSPEYLAAQQAFATEHPWFSVCRLPAESHFPMIEVPDIVAREIERFITGQDAGRDFISITARS